MNIAKCADYFHDGSLINFKHGENKIEISILSAEIIPEHMIENIPTLNKNRIAGKLYLDGIKKIKINKEPFTGALKKRMTVALLRNSAQQPSRLVAA